MHQRRVAFSMESKSLSDNHLDEFAKLKKTNSVKQKWWFFNRENEIGVGKNECIFVDEI
jgi:hypothetical protein